jgi:L-fuconolactonase
MEICRVDPSSGTPIIDTAVHLWDAATYHRMHGDWLDARPELKRSWLPADLEHDLAACGVRQAVIIEAARDRHELNLWWLELAQRHAFLGPVVAGGKLEQPDLAAWLDAYTRSEHFAGIRTMPAGAPSEWGENPATARGLAELARRDLCLELLVGWRAFAAVAALADAYPHLCIILDHCGMPPFAGGPEEWAAWSAGFQALAQRPNVTVKYASLLLYAEPVRDLARLRPPAEFLLETFGPSRLMWGSNWPVELRYGSYRDTFDVMQACAGPLSPAEQAELYGGAARHAYRIP